MSFAVLRTFAALFFLSAATSATAAEAVEISLPDVNGTPRRLADYRGRIVVVNFWATWCAPCVEEIPLLMSIEDKYAARGVEVIGISTDDRRTKRRIPYFLRRMKVTYPVWVDGNVEHMEMLGLGQALPATAILDRDGRVAARILGMARREDLKVRIEWLLGDRKAAPPAPLVDNFASSGVHTHPPGEGRGEEEHAHGGVGLEGASTVPS